MHKMIALYMHIRHWFASGITDAFTFQLSPFVINPFSLYKFLIFSCIPSLCQVKPDHLITPVKQNEMHFCQAFFLPYHKVSIVNRKFYEFKQSSFCSLHRSNRKRRQAQTARDDLINKRLFICGLLQLSSFQLVPYKNRKRPSLKSSVKVA